MDLGHEVFFHIFKTYEGVIQNHLPKVKFFNPWAVGSLIEVLDDISCFHVFKIFLVFFLFGGITPKSVYTLSISECMYSENLQDLR